LCNSDRGGGLRLSFAAAEQLTTRHVRDVLMPSLRRHRLPTVARFHDADRCPVATGDQWPCGREIDHRSGASSRDSQFDCAKYLNVKSADSVEPRHVARRCERLVVSGSDKVGNPHRTLVPVDATVQSVAMAVKSSSSQVLGDIGKHLAASDLRDDAREELAPGGETTAEERQTGVLWTDWKPHLANNG